MTVASGTLTIPVSQAMLEAGQAPSEPLLAAIARRIEQLVDGQVLEVSSHAPTACFDAVNWCHATGHELVMLVVQERGTRFWIRCRQPGGQ